MYSTCNIRYAITNSFRVISQTQGTELKLVILAGLCGGWVWAGRSDLLPEVQEKPALNNLDVENSRTPGSNAHKNNNECRKDVFNVAFMESSSTYLWRDRYNKTYYGPVYRAVETFPRVTGILLHHVPATYASVGTLLQNGTVDFCMTPLYLTPQRNPFTRSTVPMIQAPYCMVIRRAPLYPYGRVLLVPYEPLTWAAFLGALTVAVLAMHVVHLLGRLEKPWAPGDVTVERALLDVVQVTLTGGCRRPAQSLAQRIALGALLLFALVVNNAYSGQLLGLLANPPRHQDPARLADAARSLRSVYMTNDLKAAVSDANKDGSLNELLLKMRPKTFGINVKKLENMTQYGDEGIFDNTDDFKMYAYLVELTDHGQTELTQVSECFFRPGYQGFLVRRNSSAFDVLSTFALRIVQAGMYDHWKVKQRHHMDADGVTVPAGVMWRRPKPLSLSTLAGPFNVLAIVWVIAALLCGIEVIVRMLQTKKRFWR
ncbi:hypothetical protein R5R35_000726 [Gryllus longicercus]|uniref:Ionotropic receptor n=1 Tax=Gryllus longicercus TaxID=2509291 RepID=A0AAN9W1H2_9ORTH